MALNSYIANRHWFTALFAFSACLLLALVNAGGIVMRSIETTGSAPDPAWIPWVLEISSSVAVLFLIPLLLWFQRQLNLTWHNIRWRILWHIPGLLVFSLLHVSMFVLVRKFSFAALDDYYAFDTPVWFAWLYELRIDLVTYTAIMLLVYAHEFILNRLQGEASIPASQPLAGPTAPLHFTSTSSTHNYANQFLVKMLQQEYLVPVSSIVWVEAAKNYVLLHCADRTYPMRKPISHLLRELDPNQFVRVHRSTLVNLNHLAPGHPSAGNKVLTLSSGQQLAISPTYQAELDQRLRGS